MSFNRYYEKELVALRQAGKEFAEKNPALAPFLETDGRDPDVERLLESFAFLTGRLHQKLDDELPEITHSLFNLLWPHYLRPVPSCSVIQYHPTSNTSGASVIPKGTLVDSDPVNGTPCTFSTVYDVEIQPIETTGLSFITNEGKAIMRLDFRLLNSSLENLDLSQLAFFLNGDTGIVHTLYFFFLKYVHSVRITCKNSTQKEFLLGTLGPESISALGFDDKDVLFPYPANAFPGYRILQEYFCFPEKYHFVRINGLERAFARERFRDVGENTGEFSLQFVLNELPDNFESIALENIRLHCTPVVNLFEKSSTPLSFDHKQSEYRIVPDPRMPSNFSVYSVTKVFGWSAKTKGEVEYKPFESFEHLVEMDNSVAFYRLRIKPAVKDESVETWISFIHKDGALGLEDEETISIELMCSNRLLPSTLGVGDIHTGVSKDNNSIGFRNITRVTPPYMPPIEGDILWRMLSNMAVNYIPLTDIRALRGILASYDFCALHDSRRARVLARTLEGMTAVSMQETDRIYRGLPIRGAVTDLVLNIRKFSCEGDMYLFSSVLNEFLALYATVNSFHQLHVREERTGARYVWEPRLGGTRL